MIWRFSAVARVNVQCPRALEAGVSRILDHGVRHTQGKKSGNKGRPNESMYG